MKIGLIGLGKMGLNLALNMKEKEYSVIAFDKSEERVKFAQDNGVDATFSIEEMVGKMQPKRVFWLMVPAGEPVDKTIESLLPLVDKEDIIIDGGNSHYKDSIKRYTFLRNKNINFVDIGTSGGTEGARQGVCTMVGAEKSVFEFIEPLIKSISIENGYIHAGDSGAGHFLKMIHNGIEYGMLQAIGEGFEILQKSKFDFNYKDVARVWNHGSVIRGWLMELTQRAFQKSACLDELKGIVDSSGEGLWTVQEALELKVPAPVITESLMMRFRSEQVESFSGKVIAALRNEFGGHGVQKK
jgi:6-phosphogluconate dehydrogenase